MKALVMTLLVIAGSSPAASKPQFDLVCMGTPPESGNETSRDFRIDLAGGEYCTDQCASIEHIVDVTADKIVLSAVNKSNSILGVASEQKWLDRVTGTYHDIIMVSGHTFDHHMQCTTKPFTGFPATRF